MRLTFGSAVAALLMMSSNFALAAPADAQLRSSLIDYFATQGLLPILTPGTQRVGYVYDPDHLRFLHKDTECFPRLKPPQAVATDLTFILTTIGGNIGAAIGVPAAGNADVDISAQKIESISFIDVKIVEVSEGELKQAFASKTCPEIASIVNSSAAHRSPQRPLLIVGAVIYGKRNIRFKANASVDASVSLSRISSLLKKAGLDGSLSARAAAGDSHTVEIISQEIVPIALRVAYIPQTFSGQTMGSGQTVRSISRWVPFSTSDPDHRRALSQIADEMKAAVDRADSSSSHQP